MDFGVKGMVKCFNIEPKLSKKEEKSLLAYARENILKDKKCLLNWSFNKALKNYIQELKSKNNNLRKLISQKNKNVV